MPRGKGLYDDEKVADTANADNDETDKDDTPDVDERGEEPTA